MNQNIESATQFINAMKASELILGLVVLLLFIGLLYLVSRVMSLQDEKEALQKDYAPRRKRVYQVFTNWLMDVYTSGVMDLTEERQEELRNFCFDAMLWSSDRVIAQLRELQRLLSSTQEIAPERFERILFQALLEMRSDMGFRNKGLSWSRLRDMILLSQ